ncbi:hypothetical protein [Nocardia asteroides]|uniref:hypothetical protein n=1 Tax=Nocardia asteroides TaxID=1824 RepID=UPI001E2D657C|nr:hypothetical protein [Nocardia asteroides]UGT62667.1 hypothetical protein LTT61_04785 [Nocardia asteroides]
MTADEVTPDQLRALLTADETAALVLTGGQVTQVTGWTDDSMDGLLVVDRADLRARLGADPDPTALRDAAAALTEEVRLRGA